MNMFRNILVCFFICSNLMSQMLVWGHSNAKQTASQFTFNYNEGNQTPSFFQIENFQELELEETETESSESNSTPDFVNHAFGVFNFSKHPIDQFAFPKAYFSGTHSKLEIFIFLSNLRL